MPTIVQERTREDRSRDQISYICTHYLASFIKNLKHQKYTKVNLYTTLKILTSKQLSHIGQVSAFQHQAHRTINISPVNEKTNSFANTTSGKILSEGYCP